MKDLITIRDLSRSQIDHMIELALSMKKDGVYPQMGSKKVASLFFENSTRTRLSSETAAMNLGCLVNGFAGEEGTSVKKGEPLLDTARMLEAYDYNLMVMRHSLEGAARAIAEQVKIPVVNGGDGSNSHPTQTLLDLMTIKEYHGTIDGLKIGLIGDLRYGRTAHSLLHALEHFNVEVYLISPKGLDMPKWRIDDYEERSKRTPKLLRQLDTAIPELDVLYVTRIQRERFAQGIDGEVEFSKVAGKFRVDCELLKKAKTWLSVLHPLPRDKFNLEIAMEVDHTPHARYIEQARNGLFMRQAILSLLLRNDLSTEREIPISHGPKLKARAIPNGVKSGRRMIYRLSHGTVIDHIPAGLGMQVYQNLKLAGISDAEVLVALGISSESMGSKDVIAVHGQNLSVDQVYRLGLISEKLTINRIENERVVEKYHIELPSLIEGIVQCGNVKCITRPEHREFIKTKFFSEKDRNNQPMLRCYYCEQLFERGQLELV